MTIPSSAGVCPGCGLPLQGMESHCPRCGRALSISPPAPPPPAPATAAPPVITMGDCSNCGLQLPRFQPLCPNCGANVTPRQAGGWPSPGYFPPPVPAAKTLTGNRAVDIVLGFLFVFVTLMLSGIGLAAVPIAHFTLKRKYPAFTLGLNVGAGVAVILVLGAVVTCFASLKNL